MEGGLGGDGWGVDCGALKAKDRMIGRRGEGDARHDFAGWLVCIE